MELQPLNLDKNEPSKSEWGKEMARIYQQELLHNTEDWTTSHTSEPDTDYSEEVIDSDWGKAMAELYEKELKN